MERLPGLQAWRGGREGGAVAGEPAEIRITPTLIEVGDEIIAVAHVARVSVGRDPARTRRAAMLLVAGVITAALTGGAFLMGRVDFGMVLGLASAVAILVAIGLRNSEALVVGTNDGRTTVLMRKPGDFMHQVFGLLRAVMETGPHGSIGYQVDLNGERIATFDAPAPGARPAVGGMAAAALSPSSGGAPARDELAYRAPSHGQDSGNRGVTADDTPPSPKGDGTRGINPRDWPRDWFGGKAQQGSRDTASALNGSGRGHRDDRRAEPSLRAMGANEGPSTATLAYDGSPGARPASAGHDPVSSAHAQAIATPRRAQDAGVEDGRIAAGTVAAFDDMMTTIAPQYGDRFDDVRQWLSPVRAYLQTGEGSLAEAQARWSIFAKEHVPALADLAAVKESAARIGRALGLAL